MTLNNKSVNNISCLVYFNPSGGELNKRFFKLNIEKRFQLKIHQRKCF